MAYEPRKIEPKWQHYWLANHTFRAEVDAARPKLYILDMFPYPSGEGLHVGHPKGYVGTDMWSRYKRMRGFNVLHPMGWDAFGLPAEQHAVRTGQHPAQTTTQNIDRFRTQLRALGLSYDWDREINTTDPRYVKWTQWIFRKLYERGLAYQAEVPVNWCPALGTVLANEEVRDGRSDIGGHPVVRVPLKQWMLRITAYADRLLDDLDALDWPEHIKKMQRDWIGKSEGARIRFPVSGQSDLAIEVFTTRPDTLYGATYMVLAPEHELVARITTPEQEAKVREYVEAAARRSERARIADAESKTGVFTGAYADNPADGRAIPIWIADYVLASYGTGAIMAVPGHDERDHAFARRFDLPIVEVVTGGNVQEAAHTAPGVAVNSGLLDGLETERAKQRMIEWLERRGRGERTVTYKLRDWLFSRQRYWGEPFPVFHMPDGSIELVPEDQLPIELPPLEDFKPKGGFESPLSRVRDWVEVSHPVTGEPVRRDPNTMPQWAGSCWYYLRFCDPHNEREAWSREAERYWMPVDLYVGGAEHAVLHLLYARFWHKVLYDLDLVSTVEPFARLLNQGMIQGKSYRCYRSEDGDPPKFYGAGDVRYEGETPVHRGSGDPLKMVWVPTAEVRWSGERPLAPEADVQLEEVIEKMSKSRGNVVTPDDVIAEYGADALRLYEMFIGPLQKAAPWSTEGIPGVYRFLQRVHRLYSSDDGGDDAPRALPGGPGSEAQQRLLARTIADVTRHLDALEFNTAISALMVFARDVEKEAPMPRAIGEAFIKLLAPLAPHLAEEVWERLGHRTTIAYEAWPEADPALLVEDQIEVVVQIAGKTRGRVRVAAEAAQDEVLAAALADAAVQKHIVSDAPPRRVVYVPGRLINIVP